MNFKMWWRSANTGRWITQKEAKYSPDTTVSHKVSLDAQEEPLPKPWDGRIWYPLGNK